MGDILLLDNCLVHPEAGLVAKDDIFVVILSPNCTSIIHRQDNGILLSVSCMYRSLLMRCLMSSDNLNISVQNTQDVAYSLPVHGSLGNINPEKSIA